MCFRHFLLGVPKVLAHMGGLTFLFLILIQDVHERCPVRYPYLAFRGEK